jgi:hypothetical protein
VQSVASILDRFRRTAGVPAAAAEDIAGELAPVFAALERVEAEARALQEAAAEEARRVLAGAAARAVEIRADWRERAQAEYERAASESQGASAAEVEAVTVTAREEAQRVRRLGERRLAGLVEDVVACVRAAAR